MVRSVIGYSSLLLLLVGPAGAQPVRPAGTIQPGTIQPGAVVSNVRAEVDSQRVKIQYDVVGIGAADSVYIQVESRSRGILPVNTVTGDVGKAVLPGSDRTIYWDYVVDGVPIADDIRATVWVKQATSATKQTAGSGGAINALLSALVPGLGTIFVQPNRKIGARPLITVAYGGLLAYGLAQRSRAKKQYAVYAAGLNEADYNVANRWHHQYLVAVRTAAVVWAADVVYTYLTGRKNDRIRSARRVVAGYVHHTPTVGIELSF